MFGLIRTSPTTSSLPPETIGVQPSPSLAPQLSKARRAVEQAKAEAADRRAKLTLKKADLADAAGQMRRLWKLDKFNAMSDSERNAYLAKADRDRQNSVATRNPLLTHGVRHGREITICKNGQPPCCFH